MKAVTSSEALVIAGADKALSLSAEVRSPRRGAGGLEGRHGTAEQTDELQNDLCRAVM